MVFLAHLMHASSINTLKVIIHKLILMDETGMEIKSYGKKIKMIINILNIFLNIFRNYMGYLSINIIFHYSY